MKVFFEKIHPKAEIPTKKTPGSAGYDVYACLDEEIVLKPFEVSSVPTGLKVAIPAGYHLSVRPRSGLALHQQVTLMNSPGTIDSDYRGEMRILLVNFGSKDYTIKHGDRIAQILLEKNYDIEWQESKLEDTQRGQGGFGSTGR
ncbi:MAG: dUTP diphosphatase [Leptospiraceae bacterium]|nr:dUTP diphosphatase [Leptospiraceae bacterium]MDW8306016.1 dUTP diphosphatase [Leptospiraceae bacterium]